MLQTDTRVGLTEAEVLARRKKYGLNQMKEEKESKFPSFRIPSIRHHLDAKMPIDMMANMCSQQT